MAWGIGAGGQPHVPLVVQPLDLGPLRRNLGDRLDHRQGAVAGGHGEGAAAEVVEAGQDPGRRPHAQHRLLPVRRWLADVESLLDRPGDVGPHVLHLPPRDEGPPQSSSRKTISLGPCSGWIAAFCCSARLRIALFPWSARPSRSRSWLADAVAAQPARSSKRPPAAGRRLHVPPRPAKAVLVIVCLALSPEREMPIFSFSPTPGRVKQGPMRHQDENGDRGTATNGGSHQSGGTRCCGAGPRFHQTTQGPVVAFQRPGWYS